MNPFPKPIEFSAPDVDWSDGRHNRRKYNSEAERAAGYRQRRANKNKRQRAYYSAYRAWAMNPTCTHSCGCDNQIAKPVCGFCGIGACGE